MKVEIDLQKEIEDKIEKEVLRQLDNGGLLRFIRRQVIYEFEKSGCKNQLRRHESDIMQLKKEKTQ